MKKLLLSISIISAVAFAGHDTGGGGIGLRVHDQIQLYDFIESGIEDGVYVDTSIGDEMGATPAVRSVLLISKSSQDLVIAKLNEIYKLSPTYALTLLQTMKNYQWRFVKPSLISSRDIGQTPIDVNLTQLQLALRDDLQKTVTIDKENMLKMPELHQVGLFFHEIIYALSGDDNSYKARLLNSYFFHPSFQYATFEQLQERVSLVQGRNYKILDYNTYNEINSPDYSKKCDELKEETVKFNMTSLYLIQEEAKTIDNKFRKASISGNPQFSIENGREFPREGIQANFLPKVEYGINNFTYSVPRVPSFPLNTYNFIFRDFFPDSIKTVYSIPQKNQDQFKIIRAEAIKLTDKNNSKFHGNCILQRDIQILSYISSLKVINN